MNVFEGQRTVPGEGRERRARPAVERHALDAVPPGPRLLEFGGQRPLAPPVGVEDPVPQLVQPRAVAVVEADREAREIRRNVRAEHRAEAYSCDRRAMSVEASRLPT